MAKKVTKEKAIEETLWQSYDKFEIRRKELIEEGKEKYVEMKDFYSMKNVFYLEDISRWSYIINVLTPYKLDRNYQSI